MLVGVWHCDGKESRCRHSEPVKLDLEVVSLAPRAFIIPNFLSDFEADSIVKQARPHIATSSVGDADVGIQNSDTRTSKNTWLNRYSSLITQSIFLRAGGYSHTISHMYPRTHACIYALTCLLSIEPITQHITLSSILILPLPHP